MDIIETTNMQRRLECLPDIHKAEDVAVIKTMHAYFSEMYAIELDDKAYCETKTEDEAYEEASIKRKMEVHEKYWSNMSEFYFPCAVMDQPSHNWECVNHIVILRNNDEENELFLFTAKYREQKGKPAPHIAYLLMFTDDQLMIEEKFV